MDPVPKEEAQVKFPESLANRMLDEKRVPGKGKGHILYMADDFDAPLEDFKEYME
jgi:hypothetical protein